MHKIKRQPDVTVEGVEKPISINDWLKICIESHLPFGKGYANIKKADRIMAAIAVKAPPVEDGSVPLQTVEEFIELSRNDFDELYNAVQALDMKPKIALAVKSFYEAVEKAKE